FLDEPTTGLDPEARQVTWALIQQLRERGVSILLTTHYMEEAQTLADRVALIVAGRVVAEGTIEELSRLSKRGGCIRFRLSADAWLHVPDSLLRHARRSGCVAEVDGVDEVSYLRSVLAWSQASGWRLDDLEVRRPSLEDAYLDLVRDGGTDPLAGGAVA